MSASSNSTATRKRFIDFAIAQKCVITPAGYIPAADNWLKFGCCPCDSTRKSCPCTQAPEEIKKDGHCLCHLFYRDYEAYLEDKFLVKEKANV